MRLNGPGNGLIEVTHPMGEMAMSTVGITVSLVGGFALLVGGAELLVRGASRLAALFGLSSLVIGLTVVAYGTSFPELAVSVQAARDGLPGIAVGNVIGSNIFNVLFILGIASLIIPIIVSLRLIRLDVPIMIGVSVLLYVFSLDGAVGRLEGVVLVAGILSYTTWLIRTGSSENGEMVHRESGGRLKSVMSAILVTIAGFVLLVFGSRLLVDGASAMAAVFGVSDLVIGLTVVAVGTSLPELATSVVAAIRGERDIAVGNIVGSNIFNILSVLGFTSLAAGSGGIPVAADALRFDLPFMIAVAVMCLPIFTGGIINRWNGALFLGYYVFYIWLVVLAAVGSPLAPVLKTALWGVIVPLTAVVLVVSLVWSKRSPRLEKTDG